MLLLVKVVKSLLRSIDLDLLLLVGIHFLPLEFHLIFLLLNRQPSLQVLNLIL